MKKKLSIAGLVLMILVLIAGCGNSSSSSTSGDKKMVDVSMGTEAWIGYGPWWIAKEKGIFKKNGINANIVMFKQDSDINAAFASDKVQFANIASHTAMRMAANNGIAMKGIVFMDQSMTADAMITSAKYKNLAALKGKKIAYEQGTTSDLLFHQAVKTSGLKMSDFKIVYIDASDAGLALLSGKVDAAVTYEPYISSIMAKDKTVHRIYSGEQSPGLISDMTVVKSSYLKAHPELKTKLQTVWKEAMAYWKAHPKEGNQIVATATGTSAGDLPTILKGLKLYTLSQQKQAAQSGQLDKALTTIKTILTEQKELKKPISIKDMLSIQ
ncbi:MAG: ABC transporter substrate-binding protein [Sporolactobacillus sp.]